MVRNTLHVPGLHSSLCSLRARAKQPGCSFLGGDMYFPYVCLKTGTHQDCHLFYLRPPWHERNS